MVKLFFHFVRRTEWGFMDVFALFILAPAMVIWLASPYIWPAVTWINVSKVTVDDAIVGDDVILHVERELYRSTTHGSYRVTVREEPGTIACSSGFVSLPYEAGAELSYDDNVELSWWAWGPEGSCNDWTPDAGDYFVITEHCWRRFSISRLACREVRSNVFTVREADANE